MILFILCGDMACHWNWPYLSMFSFLFLVFFDSFSCSGLPVKLMWNYKIFFHIGLAVFQMFFTCSCSPGLAQRNSYGWMNGWADLCRVMGRAEHSCSPLLLSSNYFSVVVWFFPKRSRRQNVFQTRSSTELLLKSRRQNEFRTRSSTKTSILVSLRPE